MPPKRLVEVPLFSPESASRPHRKKKTPPCSSATARTVIDCFPASSKSFQSVSPSSPESPVRVPRNRFYRKGAHMVKPVCTEDIVPPKKRITFDLSDYSVDPAALLPSQSPRPQSSSTSAPTSSSLPFGQSLSLLMSDPLSPPKTSSTFAVSSCPGNSFNESFCLLV